MAKKIISYILMIVCVPAVIFAGVKFFSDKQYAWISLCICVIACVPFFLAFEKGKSGTGKMIIVAVMVAISVIGRFIFAPIPGFKPVTAVVIITALYFGSEAGFMTGALTALISNFYFGQGPWTPFQMFVWGLIGLLAGLLAKYLKDKLISLSIFGLVSGALFSLLMDIWTVLWMDGTFNLKRYIAAIVSSLPFMAVYAVSNVIFLLLLGKPVGRKLERIKHKYGI